MQSATHSLPSNHVDPAILTCSICPQRLDPDNTCDRCGRHYCEDCICPCDRVTVELALAVARRTLWYTPPTPTQTLLVQDENGAAYAQSGPGDCFLIQPDYEGEVIDGIHLPVEFIRKHQPHQATAIRTAEQQEYTTERFSVTVKPFDIEGREFTVSVFEPRLVS